MDTSFDFTTAFLLSAVPQPAMSIKRAFAFNQRLTDDPDSRAFVGMVLKSAADVIRDHGGGFGSVAYHHLKLASSACLQEMSPHHLDLYTKVCEVCGDVDQEVEKAAAIGPAAAVVPAAAALGGSAKGLAWAGVGAGSALGALYWLLSRHSRQNTAETESLEHKVDYYNQLAERMESKLGGDYKYTR